MRKNAKKFVDVICKSCGTPFKKEAKEVNRRIKGGCNNFYCKDECVPYGEHHYKDGYAPFKAYLGLAKKSSRKKGYKCDLDVQFLKDLFDKQRGLCAYTGVKLEIGKNSNEKPYSLRAASLDRIDSNKGYTKNNVEFVCLFVNWGKNGFTKKEVKDLLNEFNGGACSKGWRD